MKKILIATIILCFSLSPIHADDYETTHTFAAGDVLSADMFNELFDYIKNAEKKLTLNELVGTWSCEKVFTKNTNGTPSSNYQIKDADTKTYAANMTMTFVNDGDGSYSWSSTPLAGILGGGNKADNCNTSGHIFHYKNYYSMVHAGCNNGASSGTYYLEANFNRKTKTQFELDRPGMAGDEGPTLYCDKQAIPPKNPTAFAAATTNLSNVLTWTDNSSDETGFKVYKKTSPIGSWVLIDAGAGLTVNSNVVTYTDTVSPGEYWYRVKANNVNNGDSVGSKVVKTTNSN